jgi:hypothetical protein
MIPPLGNYLSFRAGRNLPGNTDRVLPLLQETGVVDDPRLDRPVPLHPRQHHLAHLGQNRLVRPTPFADKMQQRLMLRRHPRRRRYRSDRLHAFAFTRHHQAHAVVAQRPSSVLVANHAHKALDILSKSRFTAIGSSMIHLSLSC